VFLNTYVKDEGIKEVSFLTNYTKKLNEISRLNIDDLLKKTSNLHDIIVASNQKSPDYLYDSKLLEHNKLVLKKSLNPSTAIKVEFLNKDEKSFGVTIKNISIFPIKIIGLNFETKKSISILSEETVVLKDYRDTINFDLPRSFENLFVHKKKKETGFILEKDIAKLKITYQIFGLEKRFYSEIIPYQPKANYDKKMDIFRQKVSLEHLDFLAVDSIKKIIQFTKSFTLKEPLILPKNYTITSKKGIKINIIDGGKIISHSAFQLQGTKEQPITFFSKDHNGQGILILAEGQKSILKYVNFIGLTNLSHGLWSTSSAVTFYESPVDLDYIKIRDNTSEDALNIVRSKFKMTNSSFVNTQSDAFDGDFVNGYINSCVFEQIGNDAIDISGSDLDISNIRINKVGDKGISVGENSRIKAKKVSISNSEIAIAGKDLSEARLNNINIKNTKLGFTAFQKKPEFGPSKIYVENVTMEAVETKYLIENTSLLLVNKDTITTKQANVKSRMYGVDFGVSSKETRKQKKQDVNQ
jgi:hypothetical protein